MASFQTSEKKSFRAPWSIFWAGFLLRVAYITLAHTYRIRLSEDHLQFGWEMGRIARALVAHGVRSARLLGLLLRVPSRLRR